VVSQSREELAVLDGEAVYLDPEFQPAAQPEERAPFTIELTGLERRRIDHSRGRADAIAQAFGIGSYAQFDRTLPIVAMLADNPRLPFRLEQRWGTSMQNTAAWLVYEPATHWWERLPVAAVLTALAAELGVPEPDPDSRETQAGILPLSSEWLSGSNRARLLERSMHKLRSRIEDVGLVEDDRLDDWVNQFRRLR
jgi:hypothetical protein